MAAVYDRRVAPSFLGHFDGQDPAGGALASLVRYARSARYPVDLQFRHSPASGRDWATLYVGLTKVLDVHSTKNGLLSLNVHTTHQKNGGFDPTWKKPVKPEDLFQQWADVELYLDRIIPLATLSHGKKEGAVQVALSSYESTERIIFDRETTPSFDDASEKAAFMQACARPILEALQTADLGFGGAPTKLGNECDALGTDAQGRLLAIEVKPQGAGTVAFVTAQALMYARITQAWIEQTDETEAAEVLDGMLAQRAQVGLSGSTLNVSGPIRVVPVVALQRGSTPEIIRRMLAVRDVLAGVDPNLAPIEIYEVSLLGDLVPLDESRKPDGRPRSLNYAMAMNRQMVAWKQHPASPLPEGARAPGVVRSRSGTDVEVDYCLPAEFADYNLLPEVRDTVLNLFTARGIAWHQGEGRPTPHLRSSQIQCVNALGAMVTDPERIKRAFGDVLDVESVRDLSAIDPAESGNFLTFEFTGPKDYFGEGRGGILTRGSHSTSLDAAFAYTTSSGQPALALVEWKYTENYPSPDRTADSKLATRTSRYAASLAASDGPLRMEGIADIGSIFHEPLYQLVRQQLLAHQLRNDPEVDAQVVRVVHVSAPDNRAYQRSFVHPALRDRGATVGAVWHSLLRDPSTFVEVSSDVFLDPKITSEHYVLRYQAAD